MHRHQRQHLHRRAASMAPSTPDTSVCSGGGASVGRANGSAAAARRRAGDTRAASGGRSWRQALRNWETPAAYRTRLRVACALILLAICVRVLNGGRLRLDQLFSNVVYSSSLGDHTTFGFTVVYGPNVGFLLLSLLVRFMLHRPPPDNADNINDQVPPPRPEAPGAPHVDHHQPQTQHEHAE